MPKGRDKIPPSFGYALKPIGVRLERQELFGAIASYGDGMKRESQFLAAVAVVGLIIVCLALYHFAHMTPEESHIRLALFKSPAADAAQKLLPEFEQTTGIKVDLDVLPYADLLAKLRTEFLAGSSVYDAVMADCIWIPNFATAGYLEPISPFLADKALLPTDFNLPDVIPQVADYLGKFPANGEVYGFPFMTNTHVLAYRGDLFETYLRPQGFREPGRNLKNAWTWAEYIKAAHLLTMPSPSAPGGKLWGSSMQARAGAWIVYEWYSWLYGFGGRDLDYKTMQPQFTSAGSREAIRQYAAMVGNAAPPSVLSWGHEEETQALGSGLTAMDATWNVELTGYLVDPAKSPHAKDFKFAISPVGINGTPTPDMGGYGLLLSRFSKHKRAAFRLMAWIASPQVHKRIVLNGGTPFRFSEMTDREILAKYPVYEIYGIALQNSIYRARVPQWPEIEDAISKNLSAALAGSMSSDEAATNMQEQVAAIVNRH